MTATVDAWRGAAADGSGWDLVRTDEGFVLRDRHGELRIPVSEASRIVVTRRWFRTLVAITGSPPGVRDGLRGLTREEGRDLARAVQVALVEALTSWSEGVEATIATARQGLRWITEEVASALVAARPATSSVGPGAARSDRERKSLILTGEGVRTQVRAANEAVAAASMQAHRRFFDTVESSPLTVEQATAVVTYDNRVNVIAAAGSGKTSVMVARAAYAVQRGLARPEEILLLAFNRDAAAELQQRVRARFAAAGIPAEGVHATTFHAFGLGVIGQATGRKPTVAPWVANGQDTTVLADIVAELRDKNPGFGMDWDIFRLLFARAGDDLAQETEPDAWDPSSRVSGLRTYRGDIVRSHGERLIADWLFLHGVPYEYERPYTYDTANPHHRQYHPDFYYPDIDVWHEHWGLDAHGKPPPEWSGYEAGMAWKRQVHRQHGTTLLETTWAGIMDGTDLPRLSNELKGRGIQLRWDPDRDTNGGAKPVTDADLLRLMRTFMTHVKSNSLTEEDLAARLSLDPPT